MALSRIGREWPGEEIRMIPIPSPSDGRNHNHSLCTHDPTPLKGQPIGMYHCPMCGTMVIAGVPHGFYQEIDCPGCGAWLTDSLRQGMYDEEDAYDLVGMYDYGRKAR